MSFLYLQYTNIQILITVTLVSMQGITSSGSSSEIPSSNSSLLS